MGIQSIQSYEVGPTLEARYRVLLDQIPAVVFMAYLDQGIGEAYVMPRRLKQLSVFRKKNGSKIPCAGTANSS